MDRLTVEDCEQIAKDGFLAKNIANKNIMGLTAHIAQQLLDTMRENDENCRLLGMSAETELALRAENERLREALKSVVYEDDGLWRIGIHGDEAAPDPVQKALSCKDSDNGKL